jgi:AraC family cel operon transcriptional repressor
MNRAPTTLFLSTDSFFLFPAISLCYIDLMATLHLKNFVTDQSAACHFARPTIDTPRPEQPHDHDFIELFWIEAGRGWHFFNDTRRELAPGSLLFIRANDRHAFSAAARRDPLRMVNVAYREKIWRTLQRRYHLADLFDPKRKSPLELPLTPAQLATAQAITSELRVGRTDRLALDRFLLNLVHLAEADAEINAPHTASPPWLRTLLIDLANPNHPDPATTTEELALRAACSPEHLARTFRRCLGKPPTEVLNEAKLARAAAQLAGSPDDILQIALDAGFPNLSHFYKLFRDRYCTTPRPYRLAQQKIVWPQL